MAAWEVGQCMVSQQAPLPRRASLTFGGAAGGRPLASVSVVPRRSAFRAGGHEVRRGQPLNNISFSSFPLHVRGGKKKKGEQCRSKRHRSALLFFSFFFLMYETKSFWIKRAVSFKRGARMRQVPTQPSIIFVYFNCILFNFGPCPP